MKTYVVLVEYTLPDDADFDIAARPLMDAVRELSPCPPVQITASTGDLAERIIDTRRGNDILDCAARLHLDPDDVVTVTLGAEHYIDPDTIDNIGRLTRDLFPGHRVVVLTNDATIKAGPAKR